jgi:hypothetical protein
MNRSQTIGEDCATVGQADRRLPWRLAVDDGGLLTASGIKR